MNRKINPIEVEGTITKVFFFNAPGEYTVIDTEDYDKVKGLCWYKFIDKDGKIYAQTTLRSPAPRKGLKLHQIICPCEKELIPDHINGDGLDNRKSNLRASTQSQNQMNKCVQKNNTSGIPGVTLDKKGNKWIARISVNKKRVYLGYFGTFESAVKARKKAEEKYFGEFSYDNSRRDII